MIRKYLFLLALTAVLPTVATAAIDLTPTPAEYTAEGVTIQQLIFKDGKRRISYEPPRQWTYRGDASRLQFLPPEQNFAEGVIQLAPPLRTPGFDEATVKALEAQVINSLPAGSQGATVLSRQANPVVLNQNMSYEFVVSYQTLGQTFHRSVIFVNCPEMQLLFRFTGPKAVFENLNGAFRRSIYSWRATEPPAAPVTASK
jgi:hypothetical protein